MTVTIISEFDIREEIDKLEIGNGVCFVTGDEITRQEDHFEYWPPAAEWQDQPEIIQDCGHPASWINCCNGRKYATVDIRSIEAKEVTI